MGLGRGAARARGLRPRGRERPRAPRVPAGPPPGECGGVGKDASEAGRDLTVSVRGQRVPMMTFDNISQIHNVFTSMIQFIMFLS